MVGIVRSAGAVDPARTEERVVRPFEAAGGGYQVLLDGPLALAWLPAPNRQVARSERLVCLVEGDIYDWADVCPAAEVVLNPAAALAAGYEEHGPAIFPRLRGDYWALVWERQARRGQLVVDQLGGCSPYWAQAGGAVTFASETAELLAALPRRPEPDEVAMAHWLSSTIAPEGRSMFDGVRRLEAGCRLWLGDGSPRLDRYWMPRFQRPIACSRSEAVEMLSSALRVAVRRRVQVPSPAVLLSGGLDSSVVATLARREADGLAAYSATFPGFPQANEEHLIDLTVAALRLPSTRIVVRGGHVLAGAVHYVDRWQVPPTSPNHFFWMPLLQRAGDDGITVMLDGEGGDEVFGLSPYLLADRLAHGRLLAATRLATRIPSSNSRTDYRRILHLLWRFGVKGAAPSAIHQLVRRYRGAARYSPSWLRERSRAIWFETESVAAWKLPGLPRWWAGLLDMVMFGNGPALVHEQARRRAALWGMQARHPLVDVDVVELALHLTPDLAFDPRWSRPLLRDVVAGALPDEVRLRRGKSQFDAVFHRSLAGGELAAVRALLGAPDAEVGAYVDLAAVRRDLLDPPPTGNLQTWALAVWRLVTAECWLRQQAGRDLPESLAARKQEDLHDWRIVTA